MNNRTKNRAFSFRALIQKTWNHIKYKERGYGTPDYEEGFLGISNSGWMNFQSRLHDIVDTCKWKYRATKKRSKILFACRKFWKIPSVIESFQLAMYKAEEEIWELTDKIYKDEEEKDRLLESTIEDRVGRGKLKSITEKGWYYKDAASLFDRKIISREEYLKNKETKIFDESHEDYEDDLEYIRDLHEEWGVRIDSKYLPEEEAEDRMWTDFDNSRCDDSFEENFDYVRSFVDKDFYDYPKFLRKKFPEMYEKKKEVTTND